MGSRQARVMVLQLRTYAWITQVVMRSYVAGYCLYTYVYAFVIVASQIRKQGALEKN
jgi:hypothetical protein